MAAIGTLTNPMETAFATNNFTPFSKVYFYILPTDFLIWAACDLKSNLETFYEGKRWRRLQHVLYKPSNRSPALYKRGLKHRQKRLDHGSAHGSICHPIHTVLPYRRIGLQGWGGVGLNQQFSLVLY